MPFKTTTTLTLVCEQCGDRFPGYDSGEAQLLAHAQRSGWRGHTCAVCQLPDLRPELQARIPGEWQRYKGDPYRLTLPHFELPDLLIEVYDSGALYVYMDGLREPYSEEGNAIILGAAGSDPLSAVDDLLAKPHGKALIDLWLRGAEHPG